MNIKMCNIPELNMYNIKNPLWLRQNNYVEVRATLGPKVKVEGCSILLWIGP
jgi:hypothetical protein